ncbi:MAG: response regulator transcription factor [Caldilineaceae bacterium]|nr:response regulator transcription factor [Caldilineaceae bacterium]
MIRVLICDDQAIARHGLQMILASAPDLKVVGQAQDGQEAVELTAQLAPDVVLMDLKMPRLNGVQATRRIRSQSPDTQVLVLTTYDADEWVFDAIRAGANGYILKDTPPDQLLSAIRDAAAGKTPVDPAVAGKLFKRVADKPVPQTDALVEPLSDRELEIVQLMAGGLTNAEIGAALFLSEGTIRNYISTILGKLGVKDRTQAVVTAIRYGLIDVGGGEMGG